MNTYELLKSLVGCTITEKENGVIEIAPSVKNDISGTIKDIEVSDLSRFKEGDFLCFEIYGDIWYLILKEINSSKVLAHCALDPKGKIIDKLQHFCDTEEAYCLKRATPEQEKIILKALHNDRKVWNPDTKQIEEDCAPRVGDEFVFWNENNRDIIVAELKDTYKGDEGQDMHETSEGYQHLKCVRFQDFDFETMKPKHEK